MVADMLAQFGIKKPQIQRAVDSLSEAGKITCKVRPYAYVVDLNSQQMHVFTLLQEFGKSKIYLPLQDDVVVLNKDVSQISNFFALNVAASAQTWVALFCRKWMPRKLRSNS